MFAEHPVDYNSSFPHWTKRRFALVIHKEDWQTVVVNVAADNLHNLHMMNYVGKKKASFFIRIFRKERVQSSTSNACYDVCKHCNAFMKSSLNTTRLYQYPELQKLCCSTCNFLCSICNSVVVAEEIFFCQKRYIKDDAKR